MFNAQNVSARQASGYYEKDDYYSREGFMPARWGGKLAPELGLTSDFDQEKFVELLNGRVDGEAWKKAPSLQRAALDCTISAPKSVSIQALVKGDHRLLHAHDRAVDRAMSEVEQLARVRHTVNKKTKSVEVDGIAYASFQHHTSREGDPNLHSHNVIFKAVRGPDGELMALDNQEIMRWQKALDAIYKQQLATELRGMGYELIQTRDGFELAGYERDVIQEFSKRTQAIDAALEARGLDRSSAGGALRNAAAVATRDAKKEYDRASLVQDWRERIAHFPTHDLNADFPTPTAPTRQQAQLQEQHQAMKPHTPTLSTSTTKEQDHGYERKLFTDIPAYAGPHPAASAGRDLREMSGVSLDGLDARRSAVLLSSDALNVLSQQHAGSEDPAMRRRIDGDARADRDSTDANRNAGDREPGAGEPGNARRDDRGRQSLDADAAVSQALAHLSERQSVIRQKSDVIAEAIKAAEYRIDSDAIAKALDAKIERGEVMRGYNGRALVTRESVNAERRINDTYDKSLDAEQPIATREEADQGIAQMEKQIAERLIAEQEKANGTLLSQQERDAWYARAQLTKGQADMVRNIVTRSDGIAVCEGDAGTGKSTACEAIKITAESKGFAVYGLAPSRQAVDALKESGIDTATSQGAVKNPKYWEKINNKSVIILDEAGLIDAKSMAYITSHARERGARVVAVGDTKQFGSVEAGSALDQLRERAEKAGRLSRLDEMRRGKTDFIRDLHFASRDNSDKALDMLHDKGDIQVVRDRDQRIGDLAKHYAGMSETEREKSFVLTGKNVDRVAINQAIRTELNLQGGAIVESFEKKDLTAAELRMLGSYDKGDVISFTANTADFGRGTQLRVIDKKADRLIVDHDGKQVEFRPNKQAKHCIVGTVEQIQIAKGERLRFTANDTDKGYSNGDKATVLRIDGEHAVARLDKDKSEVKIPLNTGRPLEVRHGYAQTGHSAQGGKGSTILLHATHDDATINKNSTYTNLTRSTDRVIVFTDAAGGKQLERLRNATRRDADRDSALAAIQKPNQPKGAPEKLAYFAPKRGYEKLDVPDPKDRQAVEKVFDEAAKRYSTDGNKLFVAGSEDFKKQVVELAATKRSAITFDDKAMEKARKERIEQLDKQAAERAKKAENRPAEAAKQARATEPLQATEKAFKTPEIVQGQEKERAMQLAAVQAKAEQAKREAHATAPAPAVQGPPPPAQPTQADAQRVTRISNTAAPVQAPAQQSHTIKPRGG